MAKNIDIPNGWEKTEFGNIVILRNKKYTPKGSENLKCIELECIEKENGNLLYYLNSNTQKSTKTYFYKNDILYGKLRPYLKKFIYAKDDGVCSSEIWVFSATKKINNYFLFLIVQTNKFNYITNISTGTRMPRADWDIVSNYPILLPPLAEQEKIAEILSLWDKAIEHTKELIAYKEKQKKGLMQNLLTGKKRLHGFTDKWKTYIVKELGLVITGKTPNTEKKEYYGDEFLFITPTDIHYKYTTKTERNLSKSGLNKSKLIPKNSVLITCIASIGKNTINKSDCAINQQINAIVPNNNFYYEYIYYYMTFNSPYLLKFAGKSATSIINKTTFEEIDVTIPPLDEQKAIADILCKADEEIELLKKQLDLYTEQKKGLMQNLLTGKVRVTV